jgi:quinoprotein glucose dehydrogenase
MVIRNSLPRIALILITLVSCKNKIHEFSGWPAYNGSAQGIKYSSLSQIDTSNVNQLTVAWEYHSGGVDTVNHSQIQCNPIINHGVLYATSPSLNLFALDASSGQVKWVFNPLDPNKNKSLMDFILNNNRGVTFWEDSTEKRIFYTAGSALYAIDAVTGKMIPSFGNSGWVDLHEGLGRDVHDLYVAATSPGIIYKDLLIMGSRVSEGSDAAPGHIRAYDVRTGALRWIFHTIPHPGELGFDTWQDSIAYKHIGGANCWSGFSLDEKRGMLFVPIGSASFDFYGGKRKGAGLFADCLVALDAATGKYIWHFQDVHHDVWDRDLPTPPALVTFTKDGKAIDAVAQTTKTGFVFVLDRETGKPVFPVEERAVPDQSELPGEQLWPTQPFPTLPKPFVRQLFSESEINNLVPDSSIQDIKQRLARYKHDLMFNPPSREGTVITPGYDGGGEWGGPAFDPETGLLYVNANEMAWVLTMVDVKANRPGQETNLVAAKRIYQQTCMSCHGIDRKGTGNFPSITDVNKKYNLQQFSDLLSTGRRMMPAFKQLSTSEKNALASFILDLKPDQPKNFIPPAVPLDTFRNLPFTNTGYIKFLSKDGYPAIKPPWGTLNALNLSSGEWVWRDTLGDYPEYLAKGIHTGTENYGGPVVTAGGLLFIAATRDGKIRAFNKINGKLLWEYTLPSPGYATPAVYSVNDKEYLVIACGGGKLGTRSGDSYMAFALPGN